MAIECLVRKYDGPGGRKSGDIVSVKPSPASWNKGEGPPTYVIITVNDINMKEFESYNKRHVLTGIRDAKDSDIMVRSKYRFDLNGLLGYSKVVSSVTISKSQTTLNLINRKIEFLAKR